MQEPVREDGERVFHCNTPFTPNKIPISCCLIICQATVTTDLLNKTNSTSSSNVVLYPQCILRILYPIDFRSKWPWTLEAEVYWSKPVVSGFDLSLFGIHKFGPHQATMTWNSDLQNGVSSSLSPNILKYRIHENVWMSDMSTFIHDKHSNVLLCWCNYCERCFRRPKIKRSKRAVMKIHECTGSDHPWGSKCLSVTVSQSVQVITNAHIETDNDCHCAEKSGSVCVSASYRTG